MTPDGPRGPRIDVPLSTNRRLDDLLRREWLVTNGKGGYAAGTALGPLTRRYHGLLVSALPGPVGRLVLLSQLTERLEPGDGAPAVDLDPQRLAADGAAVSHREHLVDVRLEAGLPIWRFRAGSTVLERRVRMPHMQNTVHVEYRLLESSRSARLHLTPWIAFRPLHAPVDGGTDAGASPREGEPGPAGRSSGEAGYAVTTLGSRVEVARPGVPEMPRLRMHLRGDDLEMVLDGGGWRQIHYRREADRGYAASGRLWRFGRLCVRLAPGRVATFVASTEIWEHLAALPPGVARDRESERRRRILAGAPAPPEDETAATLALAADQFVVAPPGRERELQRIRAEGDEARTVIAGYHWFTDWGRDTMIALEGLMLETGRETEGGWTLRTFAHYVRDGLIPNRFPEGGEEGRYNTADATLWFFQALHRYVERTGDRVTLERLIPRLREIVERHREGTRFGIGVDPDDGLLVQGEEGVALTWMDAKVGDWVVTPRRGKAVEINALWYNALRLLSGWLDERGDVAEARRLADRADRVRASFHERFWRPSEGALFDVVDCLDPGEGRGDRLVDGSDPRCRPNQIFALSLAHPVLARDRWASVVETVRERLLTPVGLRTLAPDDPDYRARYFGDLRARDAAYHQGTVWPWLLGPFVDAWLRVHPDEPSDARRFLEGLVPQLELTGVGSLPEIFDAEEPHTPRGCVAQAWSVAEVLRAWRRTAEDASQRVLRQGSCSS